MKIDKKNHDKNKESDQIDILNRSTKFAKFAAVGVTIAWLANWILVEFIACSTETGGQFGDRFGATTSLFGGLTIVGLVYTIILQRDDIRIANEALRSQQKELELNRTELQLNREELKRNRQEQKLSRKEFAAQNRTLRYQRFDTTFFNLINLHNEIVKSNPTGHQAFRDFVATYIQSKESMRKAQSTEDLEKQYYSIYSTDVYGKNSVASKAEELFGQYLGNFAAIIDLINDRKTTIEARSKYYKIYFAQLTVWEKTFLMYHLNLATEEPPRAYIEYKPFLFERINPSTGNAHIAVLLGKP